jgi:predicted flap endonuclease-1-like 5' DNA nuclease
MIMFNAAVLFALRYVNTHAQDQTDGTPWWAILLLLAIVTVVVIWALTRNADFSESDAPHIEHGSSQHADVPAVDEPAFVEPAPVIPPAPQAVPDDLKLIEGIGPKIASVLNAAGIQTFAQLAETEPESISKILFDSDPRLARLGDPTTWPAQAKLAADGDMAGLQALQDALKGGRAVS